MATPPPQPKPSAGQPSRRRALAAAVAATAGACLVLQARTARASAVAADPPELREAMSRFAGTAAVREGRITLDLPELVENGNAVPVTVGVDSPMTERDHVVAIALFASRNPLPEVAEFRLGPRCGRARVAARMRLATSQHVVAMARLSDGSVWARRVEVLVTLAACVEG